MDSQPSGESQMPSSSNKNGLESDGSPSNVQDPNNKSSPSPSQAGVSTNEHQQIVTDSLITFSDSHKFIGKFQDAYFQAGLVDLKPESHEMMRGRMLGFDYRLQLGHYWHEWCNLFADVNVGNDKFGALLALLAVKRVYNGQPVDPNSEEYQEVMGTQPEWSADIPPREYGTDKAWEMVSEGMSNTQLMYVRDYINKYIPRFVSLTSFLNPWATRLADDKTLSEDEIARFETGIQAVLEESGGV
ncbi:hypothetical protein ONS96_006842 [Cadophora gregata f. sp. sojae]|nr:hypothetical protein ONS96_006842 [Cadophora gregata f. sp. sojae]